LAKFLTNLLIVCIPALLLIGYFEYKLSKMDSYYYTKEQAIEKQHDQIEILSLGSSNGFFGINPAYFSRPGYNLGYNAQSPFYDYHLLVKYIDEMPNLKVVVLPAILFTMGTDLTKTSQDWRMYFYRQYFGLPMESDADKIIPYDLITEPKTFSKIALYGSNLYSFYSHDFKDVVDCDPASTGWYDSSDAKPAKLEDKNGEISAKAHNEAVNIALFKKNLSYWRRIADILRERKIKLVVVRLPAHVTYYSNLDPDIITKFTGALTKFAEENHIKYVDYTKDKRFALEDFTFMVDHMNPRGAAKFTTLFDREVLQPLLSQPAL
jgi:hypothetical protein